MAAVIRNTAVEQTSIAPESSNELPSAARNPAMADTIQYWSDLISTNLAKASRLKRVDCDSEGSSPPSIDEEILHAPRRKSARYALAQSIASRLYPGWAYDSIEPIIHYEKDLNLLRSIVREQRLEAIRYATEHNASRNWIKRICKQGPWDEVEDPLPLTGAFSLPMPVEVSDKESLAPFFAHLRNGGTHELSSTSDSSLSTTGTEPYYDIELIEFEKGVLYSDGRVDLCKMVTGPRNIGDLMESLRGNEFSKHFLLGNNIIGPAGAQAIAAFIDALPGRFETWYLAGNCIDADGFTLLVNSMIKSYAITNIWLKRNPLGPTSAGDLFRLIAKTPNLRTLDLDQTELGDAGVSALFDLMAQHMPNTALPLRHIYLNATGIGEKACIAIANYLASSNCLIQSLYMSSNPVGDAGAAALAHGLGNNKSLKRLSLQSCGLKDVRMLLCAVAEGNSLETLDLSQGYATEDLGMRFNWITDADALVDLLTKCTTLKYLSIHYTPMLQSQLNLMLSAAVTHPKLMWLQAKSMDTGGRDIASVKAGQEHAHLSTLIKEHLRANVREAYGEGVSYEQFEAEHKRFLVSPTDVRFIDSVYRNRDAGAARRGLSKLNKHWAEDSETLQKVRDGTLV